MEHVNIELSNIQSHEHTEFSLRPGLNFILANDNNVGKSTIFKTLMLTSKMPKVSTEELNELLRVGCNKGYVAYRFCGQTIILWLFREDEKIRTFFETKYPDGQSIRSYECPKELLSALDIVLGTDGLPINFNDADSVQLIVQDSQKNDEILAKILTDSRVENIKKNIVEMRGVMQNDFDIEQARVKDAKQILSSLTYNSAIDSFKDEVSMIKACGRTLDLLGELSFSEEQPIDKLSMDDIKMSGIALKVLSSLEAIMSSINILSETKQVNADDSDTVATAINVLGSLEAVLMHMQECVKTSDIVSEETIAKMRRGIKVLSALSRAENSACQSVSASNQLISLDKEMNSLNDELSKVCQAVECPIKGTVYYSEQICIKKGTISHEH